MTILRVLLAVGMLVGTSASAAAADDNSFQNIMIPVPDTPVIRNSSSPPPALVDPLSGIPDQQIINGQVARYGDHAYACNLQYQHSQQWYFICGAVVYNENTVLTAAHCVDGRIADNFRVRCGDFHLVYSDEYEQTRSVVKIIMHNKWLSDGSRGFPNDIAVLKVDSPLELNDYVNTLPIAVKGTKIPKLCTLVGWGVTETGSISYEQRKVTIKRLSGRDCRNVWGSRIKSGHICFMDEGEPDSACNGDSGGPAVCGDYLVGVTSWGVRGCVQGYASVYTRLARYYKWILKKAV